MNTDNLSLLGITVDLNVFGFLSTFDPSWQPNYIDESARYAFGEQPDIARWNLQRIADALTGTYFVADREPDRQEKNDKDAGIWAARHRGEWMDPQEAAGVLKGFDETFEVCRVARMELRLGFPASGQPCAASGSQPACLERRWREWLATARADYPRASRGLAEITADDDASAAAKLASHAGAAGKDLETLSALIGDFRALHGERDFPAAIRAAVPSATPRSHILREAARIAELEKPGETAAAFLSEIQRLLAAPYDAAAFDLDDHEDDPREAWRGVSLKAAPPADLRLPHDQEGLDHMVRDIEAEGGSAVGRLVNAVEPGAIEGLVKDTEAKSGPIAVVVFNLGAQIGTRSLAATSLKQFELGWRMACLGLFRAAQAAMPAMVQNGKGCFLVTSSTAAMRGNEGQHSHAAAMGGRRMLKGIHVAHIIVDGPVDAPDTLGKMMGAERFAELRSTAGAHDACLPSLVMTP
eukprot:s1112_g9.t1